MAVVCSMETEHWKALIAMTNIEPVFVTWAETTCVFERMKKKIQKPNYQLNGQKEMCRLKSFLNYYKNTDVLMITNKNHAT